MFMVPLDTLCCRIQLFLLLVYLVLWAVSPVAVGYLGTHHPSKLG